MCFVPLTDDGHCPNNFPNCELPPRGVNASAPCAFSSSTSRSLSHASPSSFSTPSTMSAVPASAPESQKRVIGSVRPQVRETSASCLVLSVEREANAFDGRPSRQGSAPINLQDRGASGWAEMTEEAFPEFEVEGGGRFIDDVTGPPFPADLVYRGRMEELEGLWADVIPRAEVQLEMTAQGH